MKKSYGFMRFSLFIFIFLLCALETYAKNKKTPPASDGADIPLVTEKAKLTKEEKKALKEKNATDRKAAKARRKLERQSSVPLSLVSAFGGNDVFRAKTIENTVGNIKILVKGTMGTFQFYSVGDDGSVLPVLAGYDEFTSSFFSLLAGKKEYRLTDNIGISIGARKYETGSEFVYVIPKVAVVHVEFECLQSDPNRKHDLLKVTASVINKGKEEADFAFKNVLDTELGEQSLAHFSSAEESDLNSERQFRKFDTFKWLRSENKTAAIQFLLYGADITPPEVLSLSNKDVLMLQNWVPLIMPSRTFDSVLSYNNSAVAMNWSEARLAPEEKTSFVYYIAFASGGQAIDADAIIADLEEGRIVSGKKRDSAFPFEKLNYKYVQELIDRINALENDPEKVNREEILNLNAELDAIMEILRRNE
ncbi:MAG: hypothetical protein ACTTKL_05565 [Treponema sp.]